jgi:hypothetical protein
LSHFEHVSKSLFRIFYFVSSTKELLILKTDYEITSATAEAATTTTITATNFNAFL